MNAHPQTAEPSVAGVKVRPVVPVLLYVLLLGSALLALWAQRSAVAPDGLTRAAPWAFLAFAIGFSVYRLSLVAAKRYSAFKAFAQIIVAAMFFMMLLLPQVTTPNAPKSLAASLRDTDPTVRALAAEVAGYRAAAAEAPALVVLLADSDARVRSAAHDALVRLNGGIDLGTEGSAWRARFP